MNPKDYTALANVAWNEAADVHWKTTKDMLEEVKSPSWSFLRTPQEREYRRLNFEGKKIAQLNCNNGKDLISIERLSKCQTKGFDISEKFINQAQELSAAAGTHCQFCATDVYEIDQSEFGKYDVVVVTAGALCFMPDLPAYFEVAKNLLKPYGFLTIFESHPITEMYLLDRDRGNKPLEMVHSYFDKTPVRHETGLDYITNQTYESQPIYYFHHTLGDIIQTTIDLNFKLDYFAEHGDDPSQALKKIEAQNIKPPLSFILTCQKQPE